VAAGDWPPSAQLSREERVAAVLVDRFDLSPPVDLVALCQAYADLEEDAIPGPCDGLVVGLHGPRDRPLILLKSGRPERRQRFTLAHELGHVLLPWHVGSSYLCDPQRAFSDESYYAASAEPEANRFAAQLLVPSRWLDELYSSEGDGQVAPLLEAISGAEVSAHVACLRLAATLPAGHVFAIVDYGNNVLLSGQTRGTGIAPPPVANILDSRRLDRFAMQVEEIRYGTRQVIWWTFRGEGDADEGQLEPRTSREVLDALLERHVAPDDVTKIRQSLGGVIGSINSMAKREGVTGRDALYARFRARFAQDRGYPESLLEDPELDLWIQKRADDLST
jgi:hypothetical protein